MLDNASQEVYSIGVIICLDLSEELCLKLVSYISWVCQLGPAMYYLN